MSTAAITALGVGIQVALFVVFVVVSVRRRRVRDPWADTLRAIQDLPERTP